MAEETRRVLPRQRTPSAVTDGPRPAVPAIATGSLLLHIGVPKTGTTAIQNAVAGLGGRQPGPGLAVPGTPGFQARAALAAVEQVVGFAGGGRRPYGQHHWVALLDELKAAHGSRPDDRMFVSSEYFCEATPAQVDRIAGDLAPYRPHVVVTLRPLARILPSAWQQYLKSGHHRRYEEWLHAVLDEPRRSDVTPSFWRRHEHGAVVRRWAERVGPDRVTVLVLDPDDRSLVYRGFGELLGLPGGVLSEAPAAAENRSMTAAESELFRRLNHTLRRKDLRWDDYAHLVRYGAIMRAVRNGAPATPATALRTPGWALQAAAVLDAGSAATIAASGVRVVGPLESLSEGPPSVDVTAAQDLAVDLPSQIPVEVAVEALLGVVARATEGASWFAADGDPYASVSGSGEEEESAATAASKTLVREAVPVGRLTTAQLAAVVRTRIRQGVLRRWRTLHLRRRGR